MSPFLFTIIAALSVLGTTFWVLLQLLPNRPVISPFTHSIGSSARTMSTLQLTLIAYAFHTIVLLFFFSFFFIFVRMASQRWVTVTLVNHLSYGLNYGSTLTPSFYFYCLSSLGVLIVISTTRVVYLSVSTFCVNLKLV